MDYRIGTLRTEEIARKWLALAQRRLDHLEELHRTGRYQKFFTEQSLLAIKKATEQTAREWAALLPPMISVPEATMTPDQHAGGIGVAPDSHDEPSGAVRVSSGA
jgi:hypothetical protein